MDPATHALFGAALASGASITPRRAIVATCAAASLLPDVDAVVMPAGWDRYLVVHEIGTHSLLGAVLLGALLAAVVERFRRARHKARGGLASGAIETRRDWRIWAAAIAGATGHVFWDLADGGDIRLFWPVSPLRIGGHLAAMGDPFILSPLLLFALFAYAWPRRPRRAGAAALLVLAGVLAGRLALQHRALGVHAELTKGSAIERRTIEAEWGSLSGWWVYDRTAREVRTWHVDALTGEAALRERVPLANGRHFGEVEHLPPARRAMALWDFRFVRARRFGEGRDVLWSDVRFCRAGRCGLWFGGHIDREGRATEEVVIVGPWRLTRTIAPAGEADGH